MKTIQEMLQELSQCIVTVSGEFRFRTNWNGGKVPQPDLDVFDPNVPFCIENVGDVPVEVGLYNTNSYAVRSNCKISTNLKTWSDYNLALTNDTTSNDIGRILLQNKGDRVYIKADMTPFGSYIPRPVPYTKFIVFNPSDSKKIRARGNIASLIYGTNDAYVNKYTSTEKYCYYNMFGGCESLVQAPELPATTLADGCYSNMFTSCKSLVQAPELPATTLANSCYAYMFWYCASLTKAPELPATTLTNYCYKYMFNDCKSLVQAPELPATTLAASCYEGMFSYCASLTKAPELPAATLADSCYYDMFISCTSLTQAPELPATTLVNYCYRRMFGNCTSLTRAPELPATTLVDGCYLDMFGGCTKLNYVKCLATDTTARSCIHSWLYNVASTGTFECDNKKYFTLDSPNGIPTGWTITEINPDVEKPDLDTFDPNVPFCIENVGDVPVEVGLYNETEDVRDQCVYSYDLKTWQNYKIQPDESLSKPIVLSNNGDRVYIKASFHDIAPKFGATHFCVLNESANTKIRARGNIASLNDVAEDEYKLNYLTAPKYCYYDMFKDCASLVQGPDLPATNLETQSYFRMFYGCTSLVQAPNLPAEVLTESCYRGMFHKCTALVTPPTISAKTLAKQCCEDMFSDCTSLTQAPELPATTLAEYCYYDMFARCTSLTQAPALPAIILAPACYCSMFARCTSLTQAPELPATTLANICCLQMFRYCTNLSQAPALPATTLARGCYQSMFEGCANLSQAPELHAKWLCEDCYKRMFADCTKLNYVKCLATNGFASTGCTGMWLDNVAATGIFECDNKKYFTLDSPSGIPAGWSITEINPDIEKPDLDVFDPNVPFCIENVGDVPAKIKYFNRIYSNKVETRTLCKISYDLKTWLDYNLITAYNASDPDISEIILQNKGDRVYIKSKLINDSTLITFTTFHVSDGASIRARGNIASLTYGSNDDYKTNYLTINHQYCYNSMFFGCTSLVQAPELPATTLAYQCYYSMFYGCTSLTRAPELPATTLVENCYYLMFYNCTKLNYVKCLAKGNMSDYTPSWLYNVAATGDFYTLAATNWTTGSSGIPSGWTRHNIT